MVLHVTKWGIFGHLEHRRLGIWICGMAFRRGVIVGLGAFTVRETLMIPRRFAAWGKFPLTAMASER